MDFEKFAQEYCSSFEALFPVDEENFLVVPEEAFPAIETWYNQNRLAISTIVGFKVEEVHFHEHWPLSKKNALVLQMHSMALIAKMNFAKAIDIVPLGHSL